MRDRRIVQIPPRIELQQEVERQRLLGPVVAAAALANLDDLESENLVEQSQPLLLLVEEKQCG